MKGVLPWLVRWAPCAGTKMFSLPYTILNYLTHQPSELGTLLKNAEAEN